MAIGDQSGYITGALIGPNQFTLQTSAKPGWRQKSWYKCTKTGAQ
jgi:hypothetical protein